ncbi:hypothetical protein IWW39_002498 [Coemansia spiralis]|uniref:Uncharacterized protein n=1 Tax=Coemansia spiralis TaxID=417178 RepID=A0A9W8GKV4_9FUNG|nr:hypothetical protein IWW39_002498 [Coemansia spiralis]
MDVENDIFDVPTSCSDNEAATNIDEFITKEHLDYIMRDVSTTGESWAELRKQYSPKQSNFAPLNFAARATFTEAEMNRNLATDEAYSQAATMSAYGVELLRAALSGPQIHRKQKSRALAMYQKFIFVE